jgi:DNA polymerase III gamma/tau subunit
MLLKGAQDMNFSSSPELVFEVVLLRIASFPHIEDLHKSNPQTLNPVAAKPVQPAVAPAPAKAQSPTDKWVSFVKNLTQQDAMLGAKLENLQFLDSANNEIKLHIPAKYEFLKAHIEQENNLKKLKASIELHWGPGYTLSFSVSNKEKIEGVSVKSLQQTQTLEEKKSVQIQVSEHKRVQAVQKALNGEIKSIKTLK